MIWLFYIFAALIIWAFATRVLVWFVKFIYNIAPTLVLWALILLVVFYFDIQNKKSQEELRKDAGIARTAEN